MYPKEKNSVISLPKDIIANISYIPMLFLYVSSIFDKCCSLKLYEERNYDNFTL